MRTRNLQLDVCDYQGTVLCNLYDNNSDISGQATEVTVTYERNGWKELTFKIPSVCYGENGEERNYRLDYLIADYRIRLVDDHETDWYLISEPKITHSAFSTDMEIKAGHIAQLLKTKALDLEFSDEEGNNVGTAEQLLTAILEGTDWNVGEVAEFKDIDGTIKSRSLVESTKTGAFKMIEDLCELFEAKPVYHGNEKLVDIIPMNPFSYVGEGEIPKEVLEGQNVLEIHYDKNASEISRTANTENIVTKMYAYGAYGDATTGMCSIQTCKHKEYTIDISEIQDEDEIKFTADDATYYFLRDNAEPTDTLIWSKLDFTSQTYVWNENKTKAYHVYKSPRSTWFEAAVEENQVQNFFPALFNFNYYDKIGLFTDNMLQNVAQYQRDMPVLYEQSIQASTEFNNELSELSETAQSNTGFLKLDISKFYETDNSDPEHTGLIRLVIDKTSYPDGVIYRSDYMEARKNYFTWYVASQLKDNGLPVSGIGSVLFIVHNTNPVTWEKIYVKTIYDDDGNMYLDSEGNPGNFNYKQNDGEPAKITLWASRSSIPSWAEGDRYYLFCTDSMSGKLGEKTAEDETIVNSLQESVKEAVKDGTVNHIVYFVDSHDSPPPTTLVQVNYGWYYKYYSDVNQEGELYLCCGEKNETDWHRVYIFDTTVPSVVNGAYLLGRKTGLLYHGENNTWAKLDKNADVRCANGTSVVYRNALKRDMLYHGFYEEYKSLQPDGLQAGNYAIKNEYNNYYVFTTYNDVVAGTYLIVDTVQGQVWPDSDIEHISTFTIRQDDNVTYPSENELQIDQYIHGTVNQTGTFVNDDGKYVSNYINVYENVQYSCSHPTGYAYFYTVSKAFISSIEISSEFTIPANTRYVRFTCTALPTSSNYFCVKNYESKIYVNNKMYSVLTSVGSGDLLGINPLMKKFADTADNAYEVLLSNLLVAQETIKTQTNNLTVTLGDLLRETWWQDDKYVEGDEDKLYYDAMDNLEKVGQPEYTYEFNFLDLYGSNRDSGYSIDDNEAEWPDIEITDAAHLVDQDIDTNKWAYIDKLIKCYDQRWKTKVEINTQLSLIAQHSFTDLLSRIAEVSNETKNKQSIYIRAAALTSAGALASEKLDGSIEVARNTILGGASNWYTDDRGRMIFESADGQSAVMISGAGVLLSSSKDIWGDWEWKSALTGAGLSAEQVAAAFLYAKEALIGSITTDMISAAVGNELEISSNKALLLYATADGERPAGSLKTTDSLIEIAAGDQTNPAHINIESGGIINLKAGAEEGVDGEININTTGKLNLKSGADMTVEAGGDLYIAGGTINIQTNNQNGKFVVDSPNFKVASDGTVNLTGGIYATWGNIAGFTIAEHKTDNVVDYRYIYSGTDSISSNTNGVYIGTNGVNLGGGKLVYSVDESKLYIDANSTYIGDVTLNDAMKATFKCSSTQILLEQYHVGDLWINTDNGYNNQYICNTVSNPRTLNDWELTGTAISKGAALSIDAINGTINMTAANTISITAGATINIAANKALNLTTAGTITIGNSGRAFTIGSNGTDAYIYNGPSTIDTATDGAYFGTNGIYIRGTSSNVVHYIKATRSGTVDISGKITAGEGQIGNWYINSNALCNASTLANSTVGLYPSSTSTDVVFWAGNKTRTSANFRVYANGNVTLNALTATGADIKGTIKATSLYIGATSSSNGTQLSMDSTSGLVFSSSTTAQSAARTAAGITINADTGLVLSSTGTAASTSNSKVAALALNNGKIDISCTNVGNSSSTGIYISSTKIKASSTGDVDFSAAKSISLKAGSISLAAISDYSSYVYTKQSGISIDSAGVSISGNKYIKLDVSSSSYIHISSSGIEMSGSRVSVDGKAMWARDDIIVLKKTDNEATVIANMTALGKHDWVMIKPYYDANIAFTGNETMRTESTNKMILTQNIGGLSFGDGAGWYQYDLNIRFSTATGGGSSSVTFTIELADNASFSSSYSFSTGSLDVRSFPKTITTSTNHINKNLCKNGGSLYCRITDNSGATFTTDHIELTATCDSVTARVPCTTYYFP